MFCPSCGKQIADDAKFCEFCGNVMNNPAQPVKPEGRTAQRPVTPYPPQPKARRWQPWMTVTTVVVATVVGAGIIWGAIISGINSVREQIMALSGMGGYDVYEDYYGGYDDYYGDYEDAWEDAYDYYAGGNELMREWSMVSYDGESIWWVSFDDYEVELELQNAYGTDDYGSYEYVLIGESEFYIPQADQVYTYEINDGGNMLTISPGLVTDSAEEYWFDFN